jgi:hypothetical protein
MSEASQKLAKIKTLLESLETDLQEIRNILRGNKT